MTRLEQIARFAEEHDAELILLRGAEVENKALTWSLALTWGREAPDSPMVGAQSLGSGATMDEAIETVAQELRLPALCPECGEEVRGGLVPVHTLSCPKVQVGGG